MTQHHDQVTIHIDKKTYQSPTPTTGGELYGLVGIASGFILFREVHGQGDDEKISNDGSPVELKNGDHFYSAKEELNPGND